MSLFLPLERPGAAAGRRCILIATAAGALAGAGLATAAEPAALAAPANPATPASPVLASPTPAGDPSPTPAGGPGATRSWPNPFTARPVDDRLLAGSRAGAAAAVVTSTGSLQQTSASQVQAGANTVRDGSFANALGLTTVIQNSGANVLIQNSVTVNLQFK